MINKSDVEATMYERNEAVADLNVVPGFDPLKLMNRKRKSGEEKRDRELDFRYKKLWFRLAHRQGRIQLNRLSITERLAIFEAQVFLEKTDTEPIASFTSACSREEAGGKYIEDAQIRAMDQALTDAGFGIQFVPAPENVEQVEKDNMQIETKVSKSAAPRPAAPQRESVPKVPKPAEPEKPIAPQPVVSQREEDSLPAVSQMTAIPGKDGDTDSMPVAASETTYPSAAGSDVAAGTDRPYTETTPVEEILKVMTLEDAKAVVVTTGTCNGWTIAQVAEKRRPSLKFYLSQGYQGNNNILRAAARIVLDDLEKQEG